MTPDEVARALADHAMEDGQEKFDTLVDEAFRVSAEEVGKQVDSGVIDSDEKRIVCYLSGALGVLLTALFTRCMRVEKRVAALEWERDRE